MKKAGSVILLDEVSSDCIVAVLVFFSEVLPVFCFPEKAAASVFFPVEPLVAFFPDEGGLVGGSFDTVELLLFDFLVMVWLCADAEAMESSIIHIINKNFLIIIDWGLL